jgi:hypothetical protein
MVDKKNNTNQKVYVQSNFDNIIVVDPNKVVNPDGTVQERLVNHEELVIYANLEARVLPRTKLAVGSSFDDVVQNLRVATIGEDKDLSLNFMGLRGKEYLDTSYTDQLTGSGSLDGQGINQKQTLNSNNSRGFVNNTTTLNKQDTQLLGISRISIKMNTSYVPQVTIEMIDVQGRVLFEQGENSPYSAFMQLPYPIFTLTIKGYYGKAVRYELMLKDFNARFDPSNGNYLITTNYIGRNHALLSDIAIGNLYALPFMFPTTIEIKSQTNTQGDTTTTTNVNVSQTTKGIQKLDEVYRIYESKGLIPENFPRLTLSQLDKKLENFYKSVMSKYGDENFQPLKNTSDYNKALNTYVSSVYRRIPNSWFTKYVDPKSFIISNKFNNPIFFQFKKELDRQSKIDAIEELKTLIDENNKILNSNPTFGEDGKYNINGKTKTTNIPINITVNEIIVSNLPINDIDFEKTYALQTGNGNPQGLEDFKTQLIERLNGPTSYIVDLNNLNKTEEDVLDKIFIFFGDTQQTNTPLSNSFLGLINDINNKFNSLEEQIEQDISIELAKKIKTTDIGIGFEPTIQNMLAVICASVDAFLRLMDEVHEKAWEKRDDPKRIEVIMSGSKVTGVDTKNSVQSVTIDGKLSDTAIVYPWPHYFEQESDNKGNVSFVNKYPGSQGTKSFTQSNDFNLWPEVSFIEQYLIASVIKKQNEIDTNYPNESTQSVFVYPNAIEFPFNTRPYNDLTNVPYFYEIFERTYLSSFYSKLFKENGYRTELYSAVGDIEYFNISQSVLESPSLLEILKQFNFSYDNFVLFLRNISNNGQGASWSQFSRDEFVTPYIKNYIEKDFEIYSIDTIQTNSVAIQNSETSVNKIKNYLKDTSSNEMSFLDVYPFTNVSWLKNNLSNGNNIERPDEANNTTKTLQFFEDKKSISSFVSPITNFEWVLNTSNNPNQQSLNIGAPQQTTQFTTHEQVNNYYQNRTRNTFTLTESTLNYGSSYDPSINNLTAEQTTTLFNTPYFINSILKGVEKEKNCQENPYASLGYVVLNSLPLATLKEKSYSEFDVSAELGTNSENDYMFATLNKFSAIHELPYLWILKYGSIWYRYKKSVLDNIDILDDIWKDFNYEESYDPISSAMTKNYNIKNYIGDDYEYKNFEQTGNLTTINNGFYPKVLNDVYYFFTKTDLINDYSNIDWNNLYSNKNLRIGQINATSKFVSGYDTTNPNETIKINNWFQYMLINNNTDFGGFNEDTVLLFPSLGGIKFNQSFYECFKPNSSGFTLTQEYTGTSVYNGTVRGLWGVPNYGYFNNNYVRKPQVNEYIKVIDSTTNKQNSFNLIDNNSSISYSNIEEIFSVFSKEMLDEFENHFLNFCESNRSCNTNFVKSILPKNVPQDFSNTNVSKQYDYNLESFIKSLLIIEKPELTNNSDQDSLTLSNRQLDNFTFKNEEYISNYNIILKIGNPGKFNRYVFDSFTNNPIFNPVNRINFGTYIPNTLPTNGGTITLQQSITNNPSAWNAMKLFVGEYNDTDFIYSNNGSYLTDFFVDMDIEFNEDNVKSLNQIIKIYASKKKENPNITPTEFYDLFNEFMGQQLKFQTNVLNHVFLNLNKKLPTVNITLNDSFLSGVDGDQTKNELYETFKRLNDKWIAGQDFKTRTVFEDFIIMDRAGRPARDIIVDIDDFRGYLSKENSSSSVFALIGSLIQKNNFAYIPTPIYVNFYGQNAAQKNSPASTTIDIPNSIFGTFMNVDVQDSKPKFLLIYVDKPSEYVDQKSNPNFGFNTDVFDIDLSTDNPLREDLSGIENFSERNRCVAFNVDFGTREQGMFKSISIDMAQRRNVAPTFQVLADLGNQASGQQTAQQSASLYEFYKSQSYTCQITSMGNAMIQPTMYFNLRHVPMFYGPYLIISVAHEITTRDFITQIEGVRIPKFALPKPDKLVSSVNKNLIQKIKSQFKSLDRTSTTPTAETPSASNNNQVNNLGPASIETNCNTVYPNLEYLPLKTTSHKAVDVFNTINSFNEYDAFIKTYVFGVAKIEQGNSIGGFTCYNNNLFGIRTDVGKWVPNIETFTNGQFCSKNIAYTSFEEVKNSIEFLLIKSKFISNELLKFTNNNASIAYAQYWILTWYTGLGKNKPLNQYQNIIITQILTNTEYKKEYENAIKIFRNAITQYNNFCS